jgi:hypothetical protein
MRCLVSVLFVACLMRFAPGAPHAQSMPPPSLEVDRARMVLFSLGPASLAALWGFVGVLHYNGYSTLVAGTTNQATSSSTSRVLRHASYPRETGLARLSPTPPNGQADLITSDGLPGASSGRRQITELLADRQSVDSD